jgi:hypothetical protein
LVKVFCDAKSPHPLSCTPEADILIKQPPQSVWCTFGAAVYVLCKYQQHQAACNIYSAFAFIVQSSKKTQKFVLRATPTRCNVLAKASCGCTVQDESWKSMTIKKTEISAQHEFLKQLFRCVYRGTVLIYPDGCQKCQHMFSQCWRFFIVTHGGMHKCGQALAQGKRPWFRDCAGSATSKNGHAVAVQHSLVGPWEYIGNKTYIYQSVYISGTTVESIVCGGV